jgi:hypothetical protein
MNQALQTFTDRYFYVLFIFTLVFVILLYNLIGFDYVDELCTVGLFGLFLYVMLKSPDWSFNKAFLITLAIFAFYTVYSVRIGSNSNRAIFNDLIIQLKPYFAFFCVYQIKPVVSESRKRLLKDVCLLIWFVFLLPVGVASIVYEDIFHILMGHPLYYGIAVTVVALCYLYGSRPTRRDRIVFLILLSIGIFSGRSKFYGFFTLSVFFMLFFSGIARFKLNFKSICIIFGMLASVVLVAWQKISFYFVQAITNTSEADPDMIARFVLYRTTPDILRDYFPFGSGLASYATHSSGEFYSKIYSDYGIDMVWGISKSYHNFISDTFYPSLAQVGVAGIVLYALFWLYIVRKNISFYLKDKATNLPGMIIVMLIVGFLTIESTTGSTFIAQGGFCVMMLMGLVLSDMNRNNGQEKTNADV